MQFCDILEQQNKLHGSARMCLELDVEWFQDFGRKGLGLKCCGGKEIILKFYRIDCGIEEVNSGNYPVSSHINELIFPHFNQIQNICWLKHEIYYE